MKLIIKALFFLVFLTSNVMASATTLKQIDNIQNSTGGSSLAVPSAGATLVTDTSTVTLTNKTISGASNTITNIAASSITSGILSVSNGGTGLSSVTTNGIPFGNATSALGVTAAGSQYQTLQAGSGGVPQFLALQLNQSAAVSGVLPVANGGTGQSSLTAHDVLIGNGTSGIVQVSPSTAGFVLTSNGTSSDPSFQAISSATPSLNGGSGTPQSVTAAGGVSLTSISYNNLAWVVGSPGAVTVTATPSVTACTADGQKLTIIGTDNTKTVHLQDQANLASSGLSMNGDVTLAKDQSISFHCDITQTLWVEDNRRN